MKRRGSERDRRACVRRQRAEPLGEHRRQRHRSSVPAITGSAARQLQCEQRIAAGGLPQRLEPWPRERDARATPDQYPELQSGQRAEGEPTHMLPLGEAERRFRVGAASGHERAQGHRSEAAKREGQRRDGRPVQPRYVVDHHQQVTGSGLAAQQLEHAATERVVVHRAGRGLARQGTLNGGALGGGESGERARRRRGQQVGEPDEWELDLACRRSGGEHPPPG